MTLSGQDRLQDLQARLEAIAEELADLGYAQLAEMLDNQDPALEAEERKIARARRAVVKAAAILGAGAESEA